MGSEPEKTRVNADGEPRDGSGGSRFRLIRPLGAGGMGNAVLAEDTLLHRPVVIKTIRPDLRGDAELRQRIERECLLHAKVGAHQHIVTLYDKYEEDGQLCLVLEYVEGETLEALLGRHERDKALMPLRQALEIAAQILEALARIHAHGIIHRDIKPANIILARDETDACCAKLLDFGIARLPEEPEAGTPLTMAGRGGPGTPVYMAPEQIDPDTFGPVTAATDIYAMGILLYQMCSGQPPFSGSLTAIYKGHLTAPPPPPLPDSAWAPVRDLIERALAKRPADRFASARDLRREILQAGALAPGAAAIGASSAAPTLLEASCGETGRTELASDPGGRAGRGATLRGGASTTGARTTPPGDGAPRSRRWGGALVLMLIVAAGGGGYWKFAGGLTGPAPGPPAPAPALAAGPVKPPVVPAQHAVQPVVPAPGGGESTPDDAEPQPVAQNSSPAAAAGGGGGALEALNSNRKPQEAFATAAPGPQEPAPPPAPTPRQEEPVNLAPAKLTAEKKRDAFLGLKAEARENRKNPNFKQAEARLDQARQAERAGQLSQAHEHYRKATALYQEAIRDFSSNGFEIK